MGLDVVVFVKVVIAMGGRKCFTVEGNFDAWRSIGLKICCNLLYDKNIFDKVSEEMVELV